MTFRSILILLIRAFIFFSCFYIVIPFERQLISENRSRQTTGTGTGERRTIEIFDTRLTLNDAFILFLCDRSCETAGIKDAFIYMVGAPIPGTLNFIVS